MKRELMAQSLTSAVSNMLPLTEIVLSMESQCFMMAAARRPPTAPSTASKTAMVDQSWKGAMGRSHNTSAVYSTYGSQD